MVTLITGYQRQRHNCGQYDRQYRYEVVDVVLNCHPDNVDDYSAKKTAADEVLNPAKRPAVKHAVD